jgi:hypothetical protein
MSFAIVSMLLAGIVAKGLGVIAIIFLVGLVVGIVLTMTLTAKFRR